MLSLFAQANNSTHTPMRRHAYICVSITFFHSSAPHPRPPFLCPLLSSSTSPSPSPHMFSLARAVSHFVSSRLLCLVYALSDTQDVNFLLSLPSLVSPRIPAFGMLAHEHALHRQLDVREQQFRSEYSAFQRREAEMRRDIESLRNETEGVRWHDAHESAGLFANSTAIVL